VRLDQRSAHVAERIGPFAASLAVRAGDPLLTLDNTRRQAAVIRLNFIPRQSTLQKNPSWPILFWNIVHYCAELQPGIRQHNFRLGAEINSGTQIFY